MYVFSDYFNYSNTYFYNSNLLMRKINKIVIHHSITPRDLDIKKSVNSFNNSHKARLHPKPNWYWYHIAYHFVIWWDWTVVKTRPLKEIWYHASNYSVNKESIWICLTWNFDKEEPSEKQYLALKKIIVDLRNEFWKLAIHWHKDFANKSCPWILFDFILLNNLLSMSNKYLDQLQSKIKDWYEPIFDKHEWDNTLNEWEVKTLIDLSIFRLLKRLNEKQ